MPPRPASDDDGSPEIPGAETRSIPHDDDEQRWWPVIEILAERGSRYKVRWEGNDPATGKPWPLSWVPKHDCNKDLVGAWKLSKARKTKEARNNRSKTSTASSRPPARSVTSSSVPMTRRSVTSSSDNRVAASSSKSTSITRSPVSTSRRSLRSDTRMSPSVDDIAMPPRKKRKLVVEVLMPPALRFEREASSNARIESCQLSLSPNKPGRVAPASPVPALSLPPSSNRLVKMGPPSQKKRIAVPDPMLSPSGTGAVSPVEVTKIGPPPRQKKSAKIFHPVPVLSPTGSRTQSPDEVTKIGPPLKRKRSTKTLRPVPVMSPSVFRPHLPVEEDDPPPSSIEQFSSPERGDGRDVRRVIRNAERLVKGRDTEWVPGTNRDDESLRIRGQQVAEAAVASRSSDRSSARVEEEYDRLFRESASPEPQDSLEADVAGVEESLSQLDPDHDVVQEMVNAYVDFDGGEGPASEIGATLEPVVELSLGPDLPGAGRKMGLLQEARSNRLVHNVTRPAPADDPTTLDEYPLTSSTQQADADSQSLEHSLTLTQNRDFKLVLEEKQAQLQELEAVLARIGHEKKDLVLALGEEKNRRQELEVVLARKDVENTQLKSENTELSASITVSSNKLKEQRRATQEAETRCADLEQEIVVLRQTHETTQSNLEQCVQEQEGTIQRLRALKEESDKDRDLFKDCYERASSHFSEMKAGKEELEVELSVAKGQLSDGLPMLKGMYEERIKRIETESQKWKILSKVLSEKDERTNDDVRKRAAEVTELRHENESLKVDMTELKAELDELRDELAKLKVAPTLTPIPVPPVNEPADEPMRGANAHDFYVCQYVMIPEGNTCHATFDSPEQVEAHALQHHYPELLQWA